MLKLVLVIITLAFFTLRDALCYFFYPNLKLVTGEWDGANALTMNIYAGIVITSILISFLKTKYWLTDYFQIVTLFFCLFDILDRCMGLYQTYEIDKIIIAPACFLLPSFYYLSKYVNSQRSRVNQ